MAAELTPGIIAEYEAIFTYGDAGPHLSGTQADLARKAEQGHRDLRDAVVSWLHDADVEPPAMQPVYDLPIEPADADTAIEAIDLAEQRCTQAWRSVLADTDGDARRLALRALSESAISLARWRRAVDRKPPMEAFPGRQA